MRLAATIALTLLIAPRVAAETTVTCSSAAGERKVCPAATQGGVTLVKSDGPGACELGRTWGFDEKGVWVSEGCGGEFALEGEKPKKYGRYSPERGFKVADTEHGDLNIRVFTYVRYLNQKGLDPTYTNAFGVTSTVKERQDLQVNKAQVYFFG